MIFWLVLKLEISYRLIIKLSIKTQGVVKKSGWAENKGKKLQGETRKCTNFDASSSFTLSFFVSFSCALTIGFSSPVCLDNRVFISYGPWQSSNFVYKWEMLQTTSVKVQAMNVRCRVFEWAMATMNDKCLKLQTTSVRCKVFKWTSEWVKCRIFELVKGWNNKKS
jgi:hypothetical protein